MSRNGSGTYNLPAGNPVTTGTTISSTWANNTLSDMATALTQSIAYDGQTTPVANLPMGGYNHTNVANATARTQYASAAQVEDGTLNYLTSVAGTNAITATAPVSMSAYVAGQTFRFIAAGANTGAVTLNLNSIGAKAVTRDGTTALVTGDILAGGAYEVIYDGTQFQLVNNSNATVQVSSFSAGTTGFTPSTATSGAVTLSGTLATTNGGTGLTTFTSANNAIYSTSGSALTAGTLPVAAGGTGVTASTGANSIVLRDASQTINVANTFGFKNRIINGAMMIDQRNAGASVTPTTTGSIVYTIDRFGFVISQASKLSVQQNAGSVTPPVGFTKYLGVTSLAATSVGASDYFFFLQQIEGQNASDLAWGTANAQAVTLSFKVYSSLTGTFGGSLTNSASDRSYPFSYTISSANTWTTVSITIAGDTSGTWLTTNGVGIGVRFGLGVGSTYSGTAGAWAAGNYFAPTGATSVVGTNGATFYITGVQLEKGSTATSFDYRPYGTELALCQRYFISYGGNVANEQISMAQASQTTIAWSNLSLPVPMRTTPSLSAVSATGFNVNDGSVQNASSAIAIAAQASPLCASFTATTTGLTVGRAVRIMAITTSDKLSFSAEL